MLQLRSLPRPAVLAATALTLAAVALLCATVLRHRLADAAAQVGDGNPVFLLLAALGFGASLAARGLAWQSGLVAAGCTLTRLDATSRYAVGSLANGLLPFRAGSVVRFTLFAKAVRDVRLVAGVAAAAGSCGCLAMALLVSVTAAVGPLPAWPAMLLGAGAIGAAVASRVVARRHIGCRSLVLLSGGALVARVLAGTALSAAYGVANPLLAGMTVVVALEIAGMLPLTPGNVGVSTAAVSFALVASGVPDTLALTLGIALPALETLTSAGLGLAGLAVLTKSEGSIAHVLRPRERGGVAAALGTA